MRGTGRQGDRYPCKWQRRKQKIIGIAVYCIDTPKAEIGTLTVDLLTEEENMIVGNVPTIDQLAGRLLSVIHWIWANDQFAGLPIGLFGADMGAAVVLKVAGQLGEEVSAIVAFGGDYDLDYRKLYMVKAPTLLIVPGSDGVRRESADRVLRELCCVKKKEIIPETSFLYNHERASEIIAPLSTCWFREHLTPVVEAASV